MCITWTGSYLQWSQNSLSAGHEYKRGLHLFYDQIELEFGGLGRLKTSVMLFGEFRTLYRSRISCAITLFIQTLQSVLMFADIYEKYLAREILLTELCLEDWLGYLHNVVEILAVSWLLYSSAVRKLLLSFLASFIGLTTLLYVDNNAFISNFTQLQRRHNVTIMQSVVQHIVDNLKTNLAFPLSHVRNSGRKRVFFSVTASLI